MNPEIEAIRKRNAERKQLIGPDIERRKRRGFREKIRRRHTRDSERRVAMAEWISVKDSLPDDGTVRWSPPYLVWSGYDYFTAQRNLGKWMEADFDCWMDRMFGRMRRQVRVTHWMPLPPPPTPDGK